MPTILKRMGTLVIIGLFCLGAFPVHGIAMGNSDAADACKQGGYADLATATGEMFDNTGECVSYAAQGNEFGDGEVIEVTPEPSPEVTPEPTSEPDVTPVPEEAWVAFIVGVPTGVGCVLHVSGSAPGYEIVYLQVMQVREDGSSYPAYMSNLPVDVADDGSFAWQDSDLFIVQPTDVWIGVYDSSDYWSSVSRPLASSDPQTCDPTAS